MIKYYAIKFKDLTENEIYYLFESSYHLLRIEDNENYEILDMFEITKKEHFAFIDGYKLEHQKEKYFNELLKDRLTNKPEDLL